MVGKQHKDGEAVNADMWSRRHYLVAAVGIAALSGCTSGGDGGGTPEADEETPTPAGDSGTDTSESNGEDDGEEELPEGVSRDEFENGPVPEAYMTATSLANETREPDSLQSKADVLFAEYDEATENDAHQPGSCCGNCSEFIPDKNGDTFGACAKVDGYIDGADWCTIWEELPEPSVPEGMSESELATAEVPSQYRTAESKGGEARNPDDLFAQEDVNLTESVEAIADGAAQPGQSCGNCAEFIPDKNGDGWGACAKVEGYIAVEDWCSTYEHISEVL